jgi:hypothetical protein
MLAAGTLGAATPLSGAGAGLEGVASTGAPGAAVGGGAGGAGAG